MAAEDGKLSFSSNGSGVILRTKHGDLNFNSDEFNYYQNLFKIADINSQGVLTYNSVQLNLLLIRTDLAWPIVLKILLLVIGPQDDQGRAGWSIFFHHWLIICRLIAYSQCRRKIPNEKTLRKLHSADVPVPSAQFNLTRTRSSFAAGSVYMEYAAELRGWKLYGEDFAAQHVKFRIVSLSRVISRLSEQVNASSTASGNTAGAVNGGASSYSSDTCVVERRYSEFESFANILQVNNRGVLIPPLPPKHWQHNKLHHIITTPSDEAQRDRAIHLQLFLRDITMHPVLKYSYELKAFLESSPSGFKGFIELYTTTLREDHAQQQGDGFTTRARNASTRSQSFHETGSSSSSSIDYSTTRYLSWIEGLENVSRFVSTGTSAVAQGASSLFVSAAGYSSRNVLPHTSSSASSSSAMPRPTRSASNDSSSSSSSSSSGVSGGVSGVEGGENASAVNSVWGTFSKTVSMITAPVASSLSRVGSELASGVGGAAGVGGALGIGGGGLRGGGGGGSASASTENLLRAQLDLQERMTQFLETVAALGKKFDHIVSMEKMQRKEMLKIGKYIRSLAEMEAAPQLTPVLLLTGACIDSVAQRSESSLQYQTANALIPILYLGRYLERYRTIVGHAKRAQEEVRRLERAEREAARSVELLRLTSSDLSDAYSGRYADSSSDVGVDVGVGEGRSGTGDGSGGSGGGRRSSVNGDDSGFEGGGGGGPRRVSVRAEGQGMRHATSDAASAVWAAKEALNKANVLLAQAEDRCEAAREEASAVRSSVNDESIRLRNAHKSELLGYMYAFVSARRDECRDNCQQWCGLLSELTPSAGVGAEKTTTATITMLAAAGSSGSSSAGISSSSNSSRVVRNMLGDGALAEGESGYARTMTGGEKAEVSGAERGSDVHFKNGTFRKSSSSTHSSSGNSSLSSSSIDDHRTLDVTRPIDTFPAQLGGTSSFFHLHSTHDFHLPFSASPTSFAPVTTTSPSFLPSFYPTIPFNHSAALPPTTSAPSASIPSPALSFPPPMLYQRGTHGTSTHPPPPPGPPAPLVMTTRTREIQEREEEKEHEKEEGQQLQLQQQQKQRLYDQGDCCTFECEGEGETDAVVEVSAEEMGVVDDDRGDDDPVCGGEGFSTKEGEAIIGVGGDEGLDEGLIEGHVGDFVGKREERRGERRDRRDKGQDVVEMGIVAEIPSKLAARKGSSSSTGGKGKKSKRNR